MFNFPQLPREINKEIDDWLQGQLAYEDKMSWITVLFAVTPALAHPGFVVGTLKHNVNWNHDTWIRFFTEHVKIANFGEIDDLNFKKKVILVGKIQKFLL